MAIIYDSKYKNGRIGIPYDESSSSQHFAVFASWISTINFHWLRFTDRISDAGMDRDNTQELGWRTLKLSCAKLHAFVRASLALYLQMLYHTIHQGFVCFSDWESWGPCKRKGESARAGKRPLSDGPSRSIQPWFRFNHFGSSTCWEGEANSALERSTGSFGKGQAGGIRLAPTWN